MKKFRIVILSVILGLLLCACRGDTEYRLSELETKIMAQLAADQQIDLQELRLYSAGNLTKSYVIDDLGELAVDPMAYGAPYGDFTYEELESLLSERKGYSVDGYAFVNAVGSFEKGIAETGPIISKGDPVLKVKGNEIIVNVECITECGRKVDVELIYTNDFRDPSLKSAAFNIQRTTSEKMSKAALNTVIGMGTVFVMLIVISFIISLFGAFSGDGKKDKTEEGIDRAVKQIEKNETAEMQDTELVAVIAAAIAAYEGTTSTDGFVVRSIRKIKRQ